MGKSNAYVPALLVAFLAVGSLLGGCAPESEGPDTAAEEQSGVVGGPAAPGEAAPASSAVVRDEAVYTPDDVRIFEETMAWADSVRLDTLEIGEIIVRTGRRFVDNPYTPQTLELPGPERVIVNLREFDCVTYVESVLALARLIRDRRPDFDAFIDELARIRFRNGELDGYVSRLHYFSEWIADNEQLGLLRDITDELGGRPDDEPIDFMSTHAEAYPKLDGRPERIAEIRDVERELSRVTRSYIPESEIGAVADRIRDGDVIAATSTVQGLDIAHTGFAIRIDGRLHLMHAPLVGRSLEISEQPLAVRILRIEGQDGIMVARPL